ncbi:NAD-dependent epimerase/dehydratase family protein [Neptunomonas phycophila]|uniref:NAD-dependent epimerase/dehydratase family protein n=1 Tax=Neptunomonas phycophila TaxID=1572645 RepID=UPI0026E2C55C|nr:NAD-dependent epimerase/dehydratase family protein [Neptunomonas phycophila]MDO6467263.1 NAD-dependent epimerase/dehydratase family protein [Neptunomonas phycophila]
MKNILVLGGTGAMGKHMVKLLAERGNKVSVTTRSVHKSTTNIEYLQGNARDSGFIDPLLAKKWDAIVDFMVYSTSVFEHRAPKLLSATEQYIFLSSARVYANSEKPLTEESPLLLDTSDDIEFSATDEYSLAKARQENILREAKTKNWTIIRPYITYSDERLQLGVLEKEYWLYRALKGRTIVFSKDIATKLTTMSHGLDVANAMTELTGNPVALGEVYHITQNQAVTWNEVLNVYLNVLEKHLGVRPKVLFLDSFDFSRINQSRYQIKYDRLYNRVFNSSKIHNIVGAESFRSFEQGLTDCLEQFIKNPEYLMIDWRAEAVKDRFTGEVAKLTEPLSWKQKIKYLLYRFIKR